MNKNTFLIGIIPLIIQSLVAQVINLPSPTKPPVTQAKVEKKISSNTIVFKSTTDATFIFTNLVDLKFKKRVVVTGGQIMESIPQGGYKVEIEDARGKKYNADNYLEINSSIAQVEFFKTSTGFDFRKYTQAELEEFKREERKSTVKSIIDAHYARELNAAINRSSIESNSAIKTMNLLVERGLVSALTFSEFKELLNYMESTHYNHKKLKEIVANQKSSFFTQSTNFEYIRNVLNPLNKLESQNSLFESFWLKNGYFSIISDDIKFYCAAVREELKNLPKTEEDFIQRVERNNLELQKKEIAQKRKENENVQLQPIIINDAADTRNEPIRQDLHNKSQAESKLADPEETVKRPWYLFWNWKYWTLTEWIVYPLIGLLGILIVVGLILEDY